jgi:hypothetical protein
MEGMALKKYLKTSVKLQKSDEDGTNRAALHGKY